MDVMPSSSKKLNLGLILCIFYLIYTPTFSSNFIFSSFIIVPLISVLLFSSYFIRRDSSILSKFKNKYLFLFFFLFFISYFYSLIIYLLNCFKFNLIDSRIIQNLLPFFMIVNVVLIVDKLQKRGYTRFDIFMLLIKMAAFQGIVCLLMLIFPPLKKIANALYLRGSEGNIFVISKRVFGITTDYTYGTQIYHGFIALIACLLILDGKKVNFLYIVLILLATALNGRTGLLMLAVNIFLILLINIFYKKNGIKYLKYFILFVFLFIMGFSCLKFLSPDTYNFILEFLKDTEKLLLYNELNGNYSVLFGRYMHFPRGLNLLFGIGARVYGGKSQKFGIPPSDIGFVNDIYMGGIIYEFLLFLTYLFLLFLGSNHKNNFDKNLSFCLIIFMIIANFKGELFRSSILIFLLLFVSYVLFYYRNKDGKI